jgi:hypothetical protein
VDRVRHPRFAREEEPDRFCHDRYASSLFESVAAEGDPAKKTVERNVA